MATCGLVGPNSLPDFRTLLSPLIPSYSAFLTSLWLFKYEITHAQTLCWSLLVVSDLFQGCANGLSNVQVTDFSMN